jgi:hypothetical protein
MEKRFDCLLHTPPVAACGLTHWQGLAILEAMLRNSVKTGRDRHMRLPGAGGYWWRRHRPMGHGHGGSQRDTAG